MWSLLSIIDELVRSVRASMGGGARSPLRLDDLIGLREPAEEGGGVRVVVYEASSRLLIPRSFSRVPMNVEVSAVDSSSRSVESPPFDLVVAAVVSSSRKRPVIGEWPRSSGLAGGGPPFIYVLNNIEPINGVLGLVDGGGALTSLNPAGEPYDRDYSLAQAMDEARTSLETWMAESLVDSGVDIVILDGSLYHVPRGLLSQGTGQRVVRAWRALIESRIRAIRRLEAAGIPVVGLVKRVERSSLLSRARGLEGALASCGASVEGPASDRAIIDLALRSCRAGAPGRIVVTPKVRVETGFGAEKIAEYVVIPSSPFDSRPLSYKVYRLEYTEKSLGLLEGMGLEPSGVIALETVLTGSLAPRSVVLADSRARSLASALQYLIASALVSKGLPIGYSTGVEVAS